MDVGLYAVEELSSPHAAATQSADCGRCVIARGSGRLERSEEDAIKRSHDDRQLCIKPAFHDNDTDAIARIIARKSRVSDVRKLACRANRCQCRCRCRRMRALEHTPASWPGGTSKAQIPRKQFQRSILVTISLMSLACHEEIENVGRGCSDYASDLSARRRECRARRL